MNPSSIEAQRPAIPVWIGLTVALVAVSTSALFIRLAQAGGMPSLAIAAWRLILATAVLTPVALWRHRDELRQLPPRAWWLALGSGAFLGLHFGSWITSLEYTSVASSTVFVTTSPLIVGLLAPLFLREKLTRLLLIGILIATLGALVIAVGDSCAATADGVRCLSPGELVQGEAFLGNGLAFLGAVAVAGYLLIGRSVRQALSLNAYIWVVYGAAAIVLTLSALVLQTPLLGYRWETMQWVVLLALAPQLIGHSLFNWALRYVPAALVSVITLGEPVVATVLAVIILQEFPGAATLVGGVLILAGILMATRPTAPPAPGLPD